MSKFVFNHLAKNDWARYRIIRLRALQDAPDSFARTYVEEAEFSPAQWKARLSGQSTAIIGVLSQEDVGLVSGAALNEREGYADGVDGSCTVGVVMRHIAVVTNCLRGATQMHVTTIGLDLAKNVFQIHGICEDGEVAFNRALRRAQVLTFFEGLEPCLVGIEACGTSHHWAREISKLGH